MPRRKSRVSRDISGFNSEDGHSPGDAQSEEEESHLDIIKVRVAKEK
jgi:hypothetical protein